MDTTASGTPAAWTKIAAGFGHTCAIAADVQPGSVWCWGERAPVRTSYRRLDRPVPGRAPRARGASSPCSPLSRPPPRAGGNSQYAVGVASPSTVTTPVQVTGPIVATDVSAGYGFSCAVVGSGVKCWCAAARRPPRRG